MAKYTIAELKAMRTNVSVKLDDLVTAGVDNTPAYDILAAEFDTISNMLTHAEADHAASVEA